MTKICPAETQPAFNKLADGGNLVHFKGYFWRGTLQQVGDSAMLVCEYGIDKANPAARPAAMVEYPFPGYSLASCRLSNAMTASCTQ
jgi:hypothetical protein